MVMRRRSFAPWSAFVLALPGALPCCGGQPAHVSPPPQGSASAAALAAPVVSIPPAPEPRDDGRLPATATPESYSVSLRVDPTQTRFSGVAKIQVSVPAPTWHIVLNARDMNVTGALARVGDRAIAATPSMRLTHGGVVPEELVLTFAQPLPAGGAELQITYDAPFAKDLAGAYRVKEGDEDYVYTQFEATDARRAFPCFDEPGFKTPWSVDITAPRGMQALANSPETSSEDRPDGTVVHHFAQSRPLPSYLVAFAVGDFDVVTGQTAPFPIRVVTTKGRGNLAGPALETAAALIAQLADYFGVPYPYPKLDLVAVPDFASGAMENAGLVTFRDEVLLVDPTHATTRTRRNLPLVIAHEFAHQWFGDLVTMKWWDDLWLNEGFATWAEAKMVDAWKPSFGAQLEEVADVQHVMDLDALKSARAVRQPVHSTGDADEAFDGITYEKGAAVLRMLEGWLGPDVFRRGLQRYIHDNAWKNASADDLFKALDFVSAQKVGEIASGFLDHSGVPSVLVDWKCGGVKGGRDAGGSRLELRESEWRPLGLGGQPPRSWTLPVCIASNTQKAKSCFTLGSEPIVRDLGATCPAWLYPNAKEAGYYRFVIGRPQLLALAQSQRALDPIEQLGLVSNAWAEVREGALDPGTLLDALPMFDREMNRHVIDAVADALDGIDNALVDDASRPAFRRYVSARMAARKATLGWERPKGHPEDEDRALARIRVLETMGRLAEDKTTLAEAEQYAQKWLKDPTSVPEDVAAVAVPLASIHAGASRIEELMAASRAARAPQDRIIVARALGSFEDPVVLRKALDLVLGDGIRLSDLRYLFRGVLNHRATRDVLFAWEKDHWDKLLTHLPGSLGRQILVAVAGTMCTRADRQDAAAFFEAGTKGIEGVDRSLHEGLERADVCVALREHREADVTRRFVKK